MKHNKTCECHLCRHMEASTIFMGLAVAGGAVILITLILLF